MVGLLTETNKMKHDGCQNLSVSALKLGADITAESDAELDPATSLGDPDVLLHSRSRLTTIGLILRFMLTFRALFTERLGKRYYVLALFA